jgi:hypothetical protein
VLKMAQHFEAYGSPTSVVELSTTRVGGHSALHMLVGLASGGSSCKHQQQSMLATVHTECVLLEMLYPPCTRERGRCRQWYGASGNIHSFSPCRQLCSNINDPRVQSWAKTGLFHAF